MTIISDIALVQSNTALAVAIMIGFGALAAGIGVSLVGSKFIESAARQPEVAPYLFGRTVIIIGFIDAVLMISVGIGMFFTVAAPFANTIIQQLPLLSG
ncbi:F0F1 ATP synthase subunit C [Candidatus Synchoanobacter obligatus]|uniref:ATP synthase F(0) sector subunit c n=1 Tax=Candidatus Synchoanobacter obligatus TaxID=2919597 RepID=A0ABT1L4T9_9GAMM|nr:F0F1 ATP synthase subunit C [Candidatus Synchoanobacter obligatus]MCP8352182.1 F0F1 ATP synthase subunit C [Candidatus Synchoanobacter obligatus]